MAEAIACFFCIMMTVFVFFAGMISVWGMFEHTELGKIMMRDLKKKMEDE